MPVYNNELYLSKCLNSIINQTYVNIEIILVDDGSTDNSSILCDNYKKEYDNIIVVHQKNSGVSNARNVGLKIAKGQYIGFVDSDDWIEPDMYEILHKEIVNNNAQISIVDFLIESSDSTKIKSYKKDIYLELSACEAIKNMFYGKYFAGQLCNKLFQTCLFKGLFLNEKIAIYEDMLITWDLFFRSQKIVFRGFYKYHYLINYNSVYNSKFKESYYTINTACEMMIDKTNINFPEIIDYAKASAIVANISIAEKIFTSKSIERKYIKLAISNIRKNMTFGSLLNISGWINKISAICLYMNIYFYKTWRFIILILKKAKALIFKVFKV